MQTPLFNNTNAGKPAEPAPDAPKPLEPSGPGNVANSPTPQPPARMDLSILAGVKVLAHWQNGGGNIDPDEATILSAHELGAFVRLEEGQWKGQTIGLDWNSIGIARAGWVGLVARLTIPVGLSPGSDAIKTLCAIVPRGMKITVWDRDQELEALGVVEAAYPEGVFYRALNEKGGELCLCSATWEAVRLHPHRLVEAIEAITDPQQAEGGEA